MAKPASQSVNADSAEAFDTLEDDAELAVRIQAGDARAFDLLFERYWAPLCTFAYRYVRSREAAQDLVQDVWATVWANRAQWSIGSSVKGYLYIAVRNRALRAAERVRVEDRWGATFASVPASPAMGAKAMDAEERIVREELLAALRSAIERVPERARSVLTLRWSDGLSRTEVAQVLGVSVKTVDNHLASALHTIRSILRPYLR